ncbi:MAG: Hsp33 family molecular chaperone HslO, partial [bacterium]
MEHNVEQLKKNLKLRDRAVKAISKDGFFRVVAIKNTQAARDAQLKHNLDYMPAFLLARTMSAASMYAALMKGEERINIELFGEGYISRIFAEAIHVGEVRGFVNFNPDAPERIIEKMSDILGEGTLNVTRILLDQKEPITSIIPLKTGDVAGDMAHYFDQSEQIPTAVILDVEFDEETGLITQSGGLLLQAMPGFSKDELFKNYIMLNNLKPITKYFDDELTPKELLAEILPFEYECIGSTIIDFFCRCTKNNFMDKLMTLGINELKEMQAVDHRELVCQYCNKKYEL